MIKLHPVAFLVLGFLLLATAFAQSLGTVPADLPALNVSITRISDNRSGNPDSAGVTAGTANLSLTFSIAGSGLPVGSALRSIRVTRVANELGQVLPALVGQGEYSINTMQTSSALRTQPLTGTVNLPGAARRTRGLKFVEGAIEVFVPEMTNGSAIRIPNIRSHSGPVQHPILAKYGIEFHFLGSQASAESARASTAATSVTETPLIADSVGGYGVYFRDPSNKLLGAQLADGRGDLIPNTGGATRPTITRVSGTTAWAQLNSSQSNRAQLNDDTQLFLFVAIPEAIKTVPFRVEDIVLP